VLKRLTLSKYHSAAVFAIRPGIMLQNNFLLFATRSLLS
jgi:hypothetical protein